ncbi:hypothetical protein [Dehalococcoides mccartyi]|uniref:Uncharacterized protein n=1 Tax=Dehalococcoides mccartyi (strain CBDB1) TaxID=255470 RepID=A0A916NUT2_DEHMC|nr:hypothetical protein [Dehalococcoides mccartyi]CAI82858.1 hypothetical protein cbdbA695 [Dehalococcoides mccartyi CBDB1]
MNTELVYPSDLWLEKEARKFGLPCQDCHSPKVVYVLVGDIKPASNPLTGRLMPGIPAGAYCWRCLIKHVKTAGRIPTPMEETLFDKVRTELTGDIHPGKPLKHMVTSPGMPF